MITIPCGCNKKRVYVVTAKDGQKTTVQTLTAAMQLVRKVGGHYQMQRV